MTPSERRATFGLSLIFVLRMLGLFMILPVLALYAADLDGATPTRIGLALGIYGLTQALLQLPFGLLSDRVGRKPVIIAGLLIFVAGSALAAHAESLDMVIAGRALQGAGAIGAVVNALLADLTRDSVRSAAMAWLGVSIGACFLLAMVLGPMLNAWISGAGIFWLSAVLGLGGIAALGLVPAPARHTLSEEPRSWRELVKVLKDVELVRLDAGIFFLHAILTSLFVAVPLAMVEAGLPAAAHWRIYLPVMLLSVLLLVPGLWLSERPGGLRRSFLCAIGCLALAQVGLAAWHHSLVPLASLLLLFFGGFNVLEAMLPSLVSRRAPAGHRGAAMGVYSSLQFLGTFAGGLLGGLVLAATGLAGVFAISALCALIWFALALPMTPPAQATIERGEIPL